MPSITYDKTKANVAFIRPEFADLNVRWTLIRDVLAGEKKVKEKGTDYLPKPNPTDNSAENDVRYEQYKLRAVFYNATGRTLKGLVGQVMGTDPEAEIPAPLDTLQDDVDGAGLTLSEQASKALALNVAYGRLGLFIDYPRTDGETTVAELTAKSIRPTINIVDPWDIINWRTKVIGGAMCLSLVVIAEQYVTDDDGFRQKWDNQWRVLALDENNVFFITEWVQDKEDKEGFTVKAVDGIPQVFIPTDASGKPFDRIPFTFVGAVNNDPTPDLPPLYDLASLNLAHYRNSADYEESSYMTGQPTPFFTGLTDAWVKEVLKNEIRLGARSAVLLPASGTAGLLQASANSMPKEAMEGKERQMVALGAKLVEQKSVQRTATEAGQDKAAENSVLATVTNNVSRAYETALAFAYRYMAQGEAPEIHFQLNTSFTATAMDAPSRSQLIAEWQAGAITDAEMRGALTRAGVATLSLEEWKDEREQAILNGNIVTPGQQLQLEQAEQQGAQDNADANSDTPAQ